MDERLPEGAVVRIVPLVNEGEFVHDPLTCRWTHPETGVVIDDEHMPVELMPSAPLTRAQADYFEVLGSLDPSPAMRRHIAAAKRDLRERNGGRRA